MKSKFNFKSVSRAATLSLSFSLLAPAKSFAMDAFNEFLNNPHLAGGAVIPVDTHQAATVRTYGADDALLHEIDVRALPNDVAQIFGDMTVARHDRYLSLSGHASKLECSADDFSVLVRGTFSRIGTMHGANSILQLGNVIILPSNLDALAAAAPVGPILFAPIDFEPPIHHPAVYIVAGLAPLGAVLEDDVSSVELTDSDSSDED